MLVISSLSIGFKNTYGAKIQKKTYDCKLFGKKSLNNFLNTNLPTSRFLLKHLYLCGFQHGRFVRETSRNGPRQTSRFQLRNHRFYKYSLTGNKTFPPLGIFPTRYLYGRFQGRFQKQTSRLLSPVFMRVSRENGRLGGLY